MKRSIFATLCVLMILCSFSVNAEDKEKVIEIGDYLKFGTYNNSAILWRCVSVDDNGVLLMTDKAITKKAYDGNGSGGSHSRGISRSNGSNFWEDSNIRAWLNSDADAGELVWPCGNAPTTYNVTENAYDNEAGFLNGFTVKEKSLIKQVTQKSILDQNEYPDMTPYGEAAHIRKTAITDVVQNFDTAYGYNVKDGIFLLDVKQIKAVYDNSDILGTNYYVAKDTNGTTCRSWLRTPRTTLANSCNVRCVEVSGSIGNLTSSNGSIGVRPAFYLSETALIDDGEGTSASPYTVAGTIETTTDGGYYADTRDGEKISATAVFNSFYLGLVADSYGMFIYVASEENADKNGIFLQSGTQLTDGYFNAIVEEITDFDATIVAMPYVAKNGSTSYGEVCTAKVSDFIKWLGAIEE